MVSHVERPPVLFLALVERSARRFAEFGERFVPWYVEGRRQARFIEARFVQARFVAGCLRQVGFVPVGGKRFTCGRFRRGGFPLSRRTLWGTAS